MPQVATKELLVEEISGRCFTFAEKLPSGRIVAMEFGPSVYLRLEIGQRVTTSHYYDARDGTPGIIVGFTTDNTDHFIQVILEGKPLVPQALKCSEVKSI